MNELIKFFWRKHWWMTPLIILLCLYGKLFGGELSQSGNFSTNLVAYWKFNENAGTPRSQVGGGLGETLVNGAYLTSSGLFGGALFLDGSNDEMDTTGPAGNDEETHSCWLYIGAVKSGQVWMAIAGGKLAIQQQVTGQLRSGINSGADIMSTSTLVVDRWYHVMTSYSRANARHRLYINGSLTLGAEGANYAGAMAGGAPGWYIGGFSGQFNGKFDDVAIWHRELTPGEAQTIYNMGRGNLGDLLQ